MDTNSKKRLVYLAAPYSNSRASVREVRFQTINIAAAELILEGYYVFSPISHTHPIALARDLPLGWQYWEGYDRLMIGFCDILAILCLPGWVESVGVINECHIATELKKEIIYLLLKNGKLIHENSMPTMPR